MSRRRPKLYALPASTPCATVTAPAPKLYVQPASPPCAAVEAALTLKSIPYERVDLMPMSQLLVGPLRWGATTVPGNSGGGSRDLAEAAA